MKVAAALRACFIPLLAFSAASTAQAGGGELFIYNWSDFTPPDLIAKFEKETGVKVTVDSYDSMETLLAKLKSGSKGYDIVVVTSDFVPIFKQQGLIQRIDASAVPGYDKLEARFRQMPYDVGNEYTIPYDWGVTGYMVNSKYVKQPATSLKLLFDPPSNAKGKVGMFSSPTDVAALTELYLKQPFCETDVKELRKVAATLEDQGPSVKVYASDGIIDRLVSGEVWIQQVWDGDAARAHQNNKDLKFVFPSEGVLGWTDNIAIPSGAKDPENAKLFIEFLMKSENSALVSNFTHYRSAFSGAEEFYSADMKAAPELKLPADVKVFFTPPCPAQATALLDRIWTRLRK